MNFIKYIRPIVKLENQNKTLSSPSSLTASFLDEFDDKQAYRWHHVKENWNINSGFVSGNQFPYNKFQIKPSSNKSQ